MKNNNAILINDIATKKAYTDLIKRRLFYYLWKFYLKPMFDIVKVKPVASNEDNIILDALKSGKLIYVKGGFKATKKFSNELSKELIRLGAIYDKYDKVYRIDFNELPKDIVKYLNLSQQASQLKLNKINNFLFNLENNLDEYIESMIFNNEVITIIDDTGKQIKKNIKRLNIIEPELTEEQKEEIARNYTNNMQYYIKKWSVKNISEMRVKVQKAVLEGYREDEVVKMLQKEYKIADDKAKFLARNETNIMLAEYKKTTYTDMGFDKFIWKTRMDGLERPEHRDLNNKVFRFDEPPIIDKRTGQRGLPGETYNCRCNLIPYRDNNVFNGVI